MKKFKVFPANGLAPAFFAIGLSKYSVQCAYAYMGATVYTMDEVKAAEEYRAKVASGEIVEHFID